MVVSVTGHPKGETYQMIPRQVIKHFFSQAIKSKATRLLTLCLLFPCALCLPKLQVGSLADKTVIISKVTCSDAATVCATNKGDIYLLNQYICRRIISRYGNHYWASATGWQKEEDGKTFVFGKFHRAITFVPFFVVVCNRHLTLLCSGLLLKSRLKGSYM